MARVLAVIPARFEDARYPGKVLAKIDGRPLLAHVHETLSSLPSVERVIVGTDDERVLKAAEGFGAEVLMTSEEHRTGTDRLTEVVEYCGPDYDIILNVHGNLPGITARIVQGVLDLKLAHRDWEVTTVARPFRDAEDPLSPHAVKVVLTKRSRALYFSRSLLPFPRAKTNAIIYRHVGIYAYEREALLRFQTLPGSGLEESESLEQLRVLENDGTVGVHVVEDALPSVSAPEDLATVTRLMQSHSRAR